MVSLRSGNRTTRPSPKEVEKNEAPKPEDTPRRRVGSGPRATKKVFDEPEIEDENEQEKNVPPVTPRSSRRVASKTAETAQSAEEPTFDEVEVTQVKAVKRGSQTIPDEKEGDKASPEKLNPDGSPVMTLRSSRRLAPKTETPENIENALDLVEKKILKNQEASDISPVKKQGSPKACSVETSDDLSEDMSTERKSEGSKDVFLNSSDETDDVPETDYEEEPMEVGEEEPKDTRVENTEVVYSDDDDDEPMEISSKKPEMPITEEKADSDGDMPRKITSKVVNELYEEPKSAMAKILEKKAKQTEKSAAKKLKKRNKKKEAKKITDGVFQVKMKNSKAKFNVVTLKKGVQKILEPEVNFREELLKSRTAGTRCADTEKYLQRAAWVSK
ncbi:Protein CBG06964 [Caenorhabditis briggsae]|uniref:Protein CBG06964 n=1 Tax=Caenorhabditis briggsae TaxID=6238 RepID=A8X415_CAEBR|nr:Protein CBG06964 [Caenorhabditis briggsae]CAP27375.1 Protein CBG06964 [Caenorhabditis briggsae]